MNTNPIISLDSGWQMQAADSAESIEITLPDWSPSQPDREGGRTLIFWHDFWLEPLDYCARYILHIDNVPGAVDVYFDGDQPVGGGSAAPIALDVTDVVALETNRLRLRLDLDTVKPDGRFGKVWLEAVPCDDPA